jgi:hypothetical protein
VRPPGGITGPAPAEAVRISADFDVGATVTESELETEPEFKLAKVFDFADPVSGPGFAPDHAVIDAGRQSRR